MDYLLLIFLTALITFCFVWNHMQCKMGTLMRLPYEATDLYAVKEVSEAGF